MKFWPNFFGSLHRPRTYVDARLIHSGWGVRYSIQLLLVTACATLAYLLATTTFTTPTWRDVESILLIFAIALILRVAMLGPLVIAARFIGHAMKLPLTNAQAARLTAISYTPVAIADAVAFSVSGYAVSPPILFGCGVMMLLAAVHAAK